MSEIAIYDFSDGTVEVRIDQGTVWLSQRQMAELFETSTDNIGLHLKRIYAEGELDEAATTENSSVVQKEGGRQVSRRLALHNLDAILSVGYRVNSKKGVKFRQWATALLREHLTRGYTVNRHRYEANARELEAALELIRKTSAGPALDLPAGRGLLDLVTRYTRTFLWLQRYDEGLLAEPEGQTGGVLPTLEECHRSIDALRESMRDIGEAGGLFGQERGDALASILGNLEQSVFGEAAYPTVEAKAAHLLYFVIKNHPFSDGNKRIGAFLFMDFLNRNDRLLSPDGNPVLNDVGLAALALLVAESSPKDKEVLIRLIMTMLSGGQQEFS